MHIKYLEYALFFYQFNQPSCNTLFQQEKDDHIDWSEGDANLGWFNIHMEWINEV